MVYAWQGHPEAPVLARAPSEPGPLQWTVGCCLGLAGAAAATAVAWVLPCSARSCFGLPSLGAAAHLTDLPR